MAHLTRTVWEQERLEMDVVLSRGRFWRGREQGSESVLNGRL